MWLLGRLRPAPARLEPDVLTLDLEMPRMDGLQVLAGIKAVDPAVPVIIMTAHSDLDSAVSAYHSGAFEYLPKPFDVTEALEQVQRACRLSREAQAQHESRDAASPTPRPASSLVV